MNFNTRTKVTLTEEEMTVIDEAKKIFQKIALSSKIKGNMEQDADSIWEDINAFICYHTNNDLFCR